MTEEARQQSLALEPANVLTTVELFGKPFQIRCHEDEVLALQKSAEHINNTVKTLPQNNIAPEKMAILVALQIAAELLKFEQQMGQKLKRLDEKLENLQSKVETALNPQLELESAF